jgi:hypothetical protein
MSMRIIGGENKIPTLENVLAIHEQICKEARAIVETKGADYNRDQQKSGNTLFNLTVCAILGIVNHACVGLLVRISDKFMRLISLTKDPLREARVKDEKVKDTVIDLINYTIYLYILWREARITKMRRRNK